MKKNALFVGWYPLLYRTRHPIDCNFNYSMSGVQASVVSGWVVSWDRLVSALLIVSMVIPCALDTSVKSIVLNSVEHFKFTVPPTYEMGK